MGGILLRSGMNPRCSAEFGISRNAFIRQMKVYAGIENRQMPGAVYLKSMREKDHGKPSLK
jgi:hypothetical protein